jgi:hypothetical protein
MNNQVNRIPQQRLQPLTAISREIMSNVIVKMGRKVIQQEVQKNKSALRKKSSGKGKTQPLQPAGHGQKIRSSSDKQRRKEPPPLNKQLKKKLKRKSTHLTNCINDDLMLVDSIPQGHNRQKKEKKSDKTTQSQQASTKLTDGVKVKFKKTLVDPHPAQTTGGWGLGQGGAPGGSKVNSGWRKASG